MFGEYGELFDDNGKVTLAHNEDYKPIPLEEVKILKKSAYRRNPVST